MINDDRIGTLRAVIDRIVPPDDFPGAWDAGVGKFLEGLWAADTGRSEYFQLGLSDLDREAVSSTGSQFADLPEAEQDSILERIERGSTSMDWAIGAREFFLRLVDEVMEGYYADPGNGGNSGGVSWAMIGFEVRG